MSDNRFLQENYLDILNQSFPTFSQDSNSEQRVSYDNAYELWDFFQSSRGVVLEDDSKTPVMIVPVMSIEYFVKSDQWDRVAFECLINSLGKKMFNGEVHFTTLFRRQDQMSVCIPWSAHPQPDWNHYERITALRAGLDKAKQVVDNIDKLLRHRVGYTGQPKRDLSKPWYVYAFDNEYGYESIVATANTPAQAARILKRLKRWPARWEWAEINHKNDFFQGVEGEDPKIKDLSPEDYGNFCPE